MDWTDTRRCRWAEKRQRKIRYGEQLTTYKRCSDDVIVYLLLFLPLHSQSHCCRLLLQTQVVSCEPRLHIKKGETSSISFESFQHHHLSLSLSQRNDRSFADVSSQSVLQRCCWFLIQPVKKRGEKLWLYSLSSSSGILVNTYKALKCTWIHTVGILRQVRL